MSAYFGDWCPIGAGSILFKARTPIGMKCVHCEKPIEEGERGYLAGAIVTPPDGDSFGAIVAEHRECRHLHLAGHTLGICGCTGFEPTTPEEHYATALAAWNRPTPDLRNGPCEPC